MHIHNGEMLDAEAVMTDRWDIDSDAFMDAIEPLIPDAFRLANGMLRSRSEASDVVQDATVSAWRHRDSFRSGAVVRPWFLAIVANQCRQAVRQRWWSVITRPDLVIARESNEAALDEAETLRQGLRRLNHSDRLILVLRYYLDLSPNEVAVMLHLSPAAARVRVHRALQRLRRIIGATEDLIDE
jgi:RNA polymerase sigma factor (sigma-70 family)